MGILFLYSLVFLLFGEVLHLVFGTLPCLQVRFPVKPLDFCQTSMASLLGRTSSGTKRNQARNKYFTVASTYFSL